MSLFPGAIASFLGFTSGHTLSADQHAAQHNSEQAEIVATQTKIGTGLSTPTSGLILRGNGAGTSSWSQVNLASDVSGVLPVANGGTGIASLGAGIANFLGTPNSANLATAVTDETGSGPLVFGSSPSLTTPNIADFTNANHDHSSNSKGGSLGAGVVSFANLLATIFGGQVTTYTNPGTAGGTNSFFYVNLGGIKLFWGESTSQVVAGSGSQQATFGITLPSGFFNSIQHVTTDVGPVVASQAVETAIAAISTTAISVIISQTAGTNGGGPIHAFVVGT